MGHSGNNMTSNKVVMAGVKCSTPPQIPGRLPSSPGAPTVAPGQMENHPVNRPTIAQPDPALKPPSGTPRRPPICLQMITFQLAAEPRKIDVAKIADLASLPDMSNNRYDSDDERDNLLDLGGTEGKPPISQMQTNFSLKQLTQTMGQANYTAFNKWTKVWAAVFLEREASVHNLGTELFETGLIRTPALGDGSC